MTAGEQGRVCIIGCGRWMHCDDQIGLRIARRLAEVQLPNTRVVATESPSVDVAAYLDNGEALLVLVDGARADPGHPSGSWQRIDYRREPHRVESRTVPLDTHTLSVDAALVLAETLGLLPPEVWIYAAMVEDVEQGESMSPAIQEMIEPLARQITDDIQEWLRTGEGVGWHG